MQADNAPLFDLKEVGWVKQVRKDIIKVGGLNFCSSGQIVDFGRGSLGMIMGFNQDEALALVLGDESRIKIMQEIFSQKGSLKLSVGEQFIGRIVNALSLPCDGRPPVFTDQQRPVFCDAPATMDRDQAVDFFHTGILVIDSLVPLGKGQRQLIIGDRMTGKTSMALDIILNQKGKNVVCIYCPIGKSISSVAKVLGTLQRHSALEYSVVVCATAASCIGEQYLVPFSAATLGEYFMRQGKDVLVVFDDITKHAWAYRQLSLLLERPPGREAYPGDIFYLHAQLMERAGKLNKDLGGGSMTFLAIVDTLQGDITGFIPSNLISMTDGQIYMSSTLFSQGIKPAVDPLMSVSIIGGKIQPKKLRETSSQLRLLLAHYKELSKMAGLRTGLSDTAEFRLKRGEATVNLLKQDKEKLYSLHEEILLLLALERGFLDNLSSDQIRNFKKGIYDFVKKNNAVFLQNIHNEKLSQEELSQDLDKIINDFLKKLGYTSTEESESVHD